jgi:dihydropteroate synthase
MVDGRPIYAFTPMKKPPASLRGALELRGRRFVWGVRTYVMGIVNVTPDSFSGDGCSRVDDAVAHALTQIAAGADLLDLGAESTRPGYTPVSEEEELARLVPVVVALRERVPDAILSIDTFKPRTFRAARSAGGDLLNSIRGLNEDLLAVALELDVPVIIMHSERTANGASNLVDEVLGSLGRQAERAVGAGIAAERVILDPGIGFGKTPDENIALLSALSRLTALGFPTLIGTSRKSTLGKLTGRPVQERAFATASTLALAIAAGIDMVRVHDVAAMCDVARVGDAIVRGWRPNNWNEAL